MQFERCLSAFGEQRCCTSTFSHRRMTRSTLILFILRKVFMSNEFPGGVVDAFTLQLGVQQGVIAYSRRLRESANIRNIDRAIIWGLSHRQNNTYIKQYKLKIRSIREQKESTLVRRLQFTEMYTFHFKYHKSPNKLPPYMELLSAISGKTPVIGKA